MDKRDLMLHNLIMPKKCAFEIVDLAIHENVIPWDWRSSGRHHGNFWLALHGTGTFHEPGGAGFGPGDAFLFAPHDRIRATGHASRRVVNFTIHFHGVLPGFRAGLFDAETRHGGSLPDALWLEPFCRELCRHFGEDTKEGRDVVGTGVEFLMASLASSRHRPPLSAASRRVLAEADRIRRNPAADYRLAELAGRAGLSVPHFVRLFRSHLGCTPGRLMIQERVQRARRLLRESDSKLEMIAEQAGYRDVFYFSRQFRSVTGLTPGEYRRQFR
ncbi:MAG: hypothetical protein Fur0032_07540 [Terrimicrobiaceae bacterium]